MPVPIPQLVENWKKQLLDLSKRNNLLNFVKTRRGSLHIVYPGFVELFDALLNGQELRFAKPSEQDEYEAFLGEDKYHKTPFSIKSDKEELKDEIAALKNLKRRSKTIIEEQGINVLHIAFGLVRWKEFEDSEEYYTSPLLLMPVSLQINSVVDPFTLSIYEDDIIVNPTLSHKLEKDYNIVLPEYGDTDDLESYIHLCESKINEHPGWAVEREAYLSIFSFLKINMYYDLDKHLEDAESNDFILALSGDTSHLQSNDEIVTSIDGLDYDKNIDPKDVYQVLDADESQRVAIELAKRGASFVLQGPPGTGKSQTITNIIAESLAAGKTVLFVSEKEAALDVVKNRLNQTRLLDFCLPMHSHKANKKDIIKELYRTAELDRTRTKEGALTELDKLYKNRLRLDNLSAELHTRIAPLNFTVFEANGYLASMEQVPNYVFSIPRIDTIGVSQLGQILAALDLLKQNVERFHGDRFSALWNANSLPSLTNEHKYYFKAEITPELSELIGEFNHSLSSRLGDHVHVSWAQIPELLKFLTICDTPYLVPAKWLDTSPDDLESLTNKWKSAFESISEDRSFIESHFESSVVEFNPSELAVASSALVPAVVEHTSIAPVDKNDAGYYAWVQNLKEESDSVLRWLELYEENSAPLLTADASKQSIDSSFFESVSEVSNALASLRLSNPVWFSRKAVNEVEDFLSTLVTKRKEVEAIRSEIRNSYDKGIFDIDVKQLLPRFRTSYKSFFRIFNGSYKKDIRSIQGFCKTGKVSYAEGLAILNKLNQLLDAEEWYDSKRSFAEEFFCVDTVEGIDVDLAKIEKDRVDNILSFFNDNVPATVVQQIRDRYYSTDESIKCAKTLRIICIDQPAIDKIHTFIKNQVRNPFLTVSENATTVSRLSQTVLSEIDKLANHTDSLPTNLEFLAHLTKWQEFLGRFDLENESLRRLYGADYNGIDTDWELALKKIQWLREFCPFISLFTVSRSFAESVCSGEVSRKDLISLDELTRRLYTSQNRMAIDRFNSWFPESNSISAIPTIAMKEIADYYIANIDILDSWISYRQAYMAVEKLGLSAYLDVVVNAPTVRSDLYIDIFKKQFYSLWVDFALTQLPALSSVSKLEREKILSDFKEEDTKQFQIAQARIREILSERLPNTTLTASANDQLGLLKREYYKQRRQMPIRKLFNSIPELVMRLKPCLMMSPLSVSLYLENPSYVFDVVIFDEASQIKPENAIGSILRAKQVVVAGDTNQLPPTNFFQVGLNDADFYDDDEEDVSTEESILDSCARVLPEQYLRWHYRSRHEHLIAFSNAKIYDNRLTTFPSSIDIEKDRGVEFYKVENGVYDRSRKKDNPFEAECVADLVFEHFKNHPDRSLGVIANSEAQARTIEETIGRRRERNPRFEVFFREERYEPFFVKSLESVQGDERDTIIFSVGYGKDAAGRMVQNFGPINRDGGHRRLNVAVTRAKYNFKLVASIGPEAIEVTDSTKEGPRLLKAYIDYAKRGLIALTGEINDGHGLSFDSPFEESVYNYLKENNLMVATQVGCAGYRIDLGVKDPNNPGRYLLAIECDGATYHSSRYARERDRLRQQVLESMGWKFHRIWSTEWIRNTAVAKSELMNAVKSALYEGTILDTQAQPDKFEEVVPTFEEEVLVPEDENVGIGDILRFAEYVQADDLIKHMTSKRLALETIIKYEAPIHIDMLCRKMAPMFGLQKATSTVKRPVLGFIQAQNHKTLVFQDPFVYPFPRKKEYVMRVSDLFKRDINEIPPEEIEYAMLAVARNTVGISEETLIEDTAHCMGYVHTKSKLRNRLKIVFDRLVAKGDLIVTPSNSIKAKDEEPVTPLHKQKGENIAIVVDSLLNHIESKEENVSPYDVYLHAKQVYDKMLPLINGIMAERNVCRIIDQEIHMPQPNGKDVDINYKVLMVLFIDLIKCYHYMGHPIHVDKKDSYILHMALNIKLGFDLDTEDDYEAFITTDSVTFLFKSMLRSFEGWAKSDGKEFLFPRFVKDVNKNICGQYVNLMLEASKFIMNAAPANNSFEKEWISELDRLSY